jgi:hypothetical protein
MNLGKCAVCVIDWETAKEAGRAEHLRPQPMPAEVLLEGTGLCRPHLRRELREPTTPAMTITRADDATG